MSTSADNMLLMLGEDGFVFLDDRPWPFAVKRDSEGWGLYYWSEGNKGFVSMRRLSAEEAEHFRIHALPKEQAQLYFLVLPEICKAGGTPALPGK